MKECIKKNKKYIIIGGAGLLAVILAIILLVVLLPKKTAEEPVTTEVETTADTVNVEDPVEKPEIEDDEMETAELPDNANILEVDESVNTPSYSSTGEKAEEGKSYETPAEAPSNDGGGSSGGGIIIGGGSYETEAYSCGCANHHCNGPETHAYVCELETEGCPYCGSHSCPSFYGTDEWGNGGLFPELCPKYDIHKDPVYYCQSCGKKTGDGTNGTCAQFVNACNCPNCGVWVDSWTCHTCK